MPEVERLKRQGSISFLRVHEVGTAYGGGDERIDVEVVVSLDSHSDERYGFQLRENGAGPAYQGMLDLLREAFFRNHPVTLDVDLEDGKKNGMLVRVILTRS